MIIQCPIRAVSSPNPQTPETIKLNRCKKMTITGVVAILVNVDELIFFFNNQNKNCTLDETYTEIDQNSENCSSYTIQPTLIFC